MFSERETTVLLVQEIAAAIGARFVGNPEVAVQCPRSPDEAGPRDLALAMDARYADLLGNSPARAAVLWSDADWDSFGLDAAILVDRPRYAMAGITQAFSTAPELAAGIHPTAIIAPDAEIGTGAHVGPFAIIGACVKIGANARIHAHSSIAEDARIGDDALIREGVRIAQGVRVGDRVIIHQNATIGSDGFSFVTPKPGAVDEVKATGNVSDAQEAQSYTRIYSIGSVAVGDDVEIGASTTIDRGTVADTRIGNGTKIDNLVQIGHNVRIGETCLVCAQVGIAGSAVIGDRVVLAGQVGVADHVTVGSDVIAAGKSGISSNVPPNRAIMGNPAVRMDANIESYKAYRRLPRLLARLDALEKSVSNMDPKR